MNKSVLAAVFAASVLAACGGGGGGGGSGPIRPSDTVPAGDTGPTLAPLGQVPPTEGQIDFSAASSLTPAQVGSVATQDGAVLSPQVALSSTSVRVSIPELGVLNDTFSASDVQLPRTFVAGAGVQIKASSHPIGNNNKASTLTYIALGGDSTRALQYSTLGVWDMADISTGVISQTAAISSGTRTLVSDIPTTGTANYVGFMVGNAFQDSNQYSVTALATATANFGTRNIAFSTSGTTATTRVGAALNDASGLNMSGTLTYPADQNALSGKLSTADGKLAGNATGNFFGPQASELGVTFKLNGTNSSLVGGAALKR